MSSTRFSRISDAGAAEMLATAKDPSWRDFNRAGPSVGTPAENYADLLALLRLFDATFKGPDRSLPKVRSFIL